MFRGTLPRPEHVPRSAARWPLRRSVTQRATADTSRKRVPKASERLAPPASGGGSRRAIHFTGYLDGGRLVRGTYRLGISATAASGRKGPPSQWINVVVTT